MNDKRSVSWDFVSSRIEEIVKEINLVFRKKESKIKIYGIPSGGKYVEGLIVTRNMFRFKSVDSPSKADVIVDDIYDSGATFNRYSKYKKEIWILVDKRKKEFKDAWVVLPWDCKEEDEKETEDYAMRIIQKKGFPGAVDYINKLASTAMAKK